MLFNHTGYHAASRVMPSLVIRVVMLFDDDENREREEEMVEQEKPKDKHDQAKYANSL
jgi:hypothetical protein